MAVHITDVTFNITHVIFITIVQFACSIAQGIVLSGL